MLCTGATPGSNKRRRVQAYKAERHKRIAVALSRMSAAAEELKTGAQKQVCAAVPAALAVLAPPLTRIARSGPAGQRGGAPAAVQLAHAGPVGDDPQREALLHARHHALLRAPLHPAAPIPHGALLCVAGRRASAAVLRCFAPCLRAQCAAADPVCVLQMRTSRVWAAPPAGSTPTLVRLLRRRVRSPDVAVVDPC
jgi:hypothetical protein